jgi:NAD-dependent deacetylase
VRPDKPRLLLFLGAGASADSGLPTFRTGAAPVWAGASAEEVCDIRTWQANYERVLAFYDDQRAALASVAPNAMHAAVARWQRRYDTVLFTTNVDDLLERAGCRDVLHLHGSLLGMVCRACAATWPVAPGRRTAPDAACPACGATRSVKPAVEFFGEDGPLHAVFDAAFKSDAMHPGDVTLVIGASGYSVPMEFFCWRRPGFRVLNNLAPSPWIDERLFDRVIHARAVDAVGEIDAILAARLG